MPESSEGISAQVVETPNNETNNDSSVVLETTQETVQETGSGQEFVSKAENEKVKKEAQALRARLRAAEEANKALEDAKLSDQERKDKRLAELEAKFLDVDTKHKTELTTLAVKLEAQKRGIIDPEAAAKLLDWTRIEYDEEGRPGNIDELLKEMAVERPYLVAAAQAAPPPSTGAPANPATHATGSTNSPVVSGHFDYKSWKENKAAIMEAAREGTLTS